jgi:ribose transport system substrate-binding protein
VDEGDQERCLEQLSSALAEHSDVACLVGLNAYHGGVIVEALKQQDMLGKVEAVAFDTEDETLDAIEAGHIFATIAQDPYQYGYEAVRRLVYNCQRTGHQLPLIGVQSTVAISTKTLRKADIEEFRKRHRELLATGKKPTED